MATLEELRVQLDEIDEQMVRLYETRMQVCEEVGKYKVQTGKKVLTNREKKASLQMLHRK